MDSSGSWAGSLDMELGSLTRIGTSTPQLVNEAQPSSSEASVRALGPRNSAGSDNRPREAFLRRELKQLDIFMIAISTIIGMGFYVNTGEIQYLGGPGAVVYSFILVGIVAFLVMHGLSTMLQIWPVAGAHVAFVEEFVDKEMAAAMAVIYWFTYCFVYASLTITIGQLFEYYRPHLHVNAFSIACLAIPILVNLTDIRVFRWIEIGFGTFKLSIAIAIIIMMHVVNPEANDKCASGKVERSLMFEPGYNAKWSGFAFPATVLLASFAFIGIEAIATTAQEADFGAKPNDSSTQASHQSQSTDVTDGDSKEESPFNLAMWVPIVVTIIYVWGSWAVSQNVSPKDENLPTFGFPTRSTATATSTSTGTTTTTASSTSTPTSNSIFVISAAEVCEPGKMPIVVNTLLLLNVLFTSSTSLYIASRTLFGFAYTLYKRNFDQNPWWLPIVRALCHKSTFDVPWVAVLVSAWLFWVPFLRFGNNKVFVSKILDIFITMSSFSGLVVWALESFAAFRFYECCKIYHDIHGRLPLKIRSSINFDQPFEYYTRRAISGISFTLCCLIIILGGIIKICLKKEDKAFHAAPYSIIGIFFLVTIVLKWHKGFSKAKLGVDISRGKDIFDNLDDLMKHNTETKNRKDLSRWDFFGIIDSDWVMKSLRRTRRRRSHR